MDSWPEEKTRNVFCFFFFGVLTIAFHEVMTAAARDVLAGSSSTVLAAVLSTGVPQVVVRITMPWIIQKIPHVYKVVIIFILFASGLVMLVVSPDPAVRLAGMSVAELGTAMAEMAFLSQSAFYSHVTTSAFAAGIGVGSVIGPLYYTATATWFCVAPRIAIAIILPVVYGSMDRSPLRDPWEKPPSHNGIQYELLAAVDETFENKLTWSRRGAIGWLISSLIVFLYWVNFADFLSNRAVVTTMAFQQAPFRARDHYNYYALCSRLGNLFGLSYLLVVSYTCPSQLKRVRINRIWILALIAVSHNLFFVTMSWYRYASQVGVIMALCFTGGFTTGAIYSHSPHAVREKAVDNNSREFGLSLLTLGVSAGQLANGLLGLYTEEALKEYCLYALKLKALCFTEFTKPGWIGNNRCSK